MMTIKKQVEELLMTGWFSNFQIQQITKSSSADREARRLRNNPPEGFIFKQRNKQKIKPEQRSCLEYTLERI